MEPLVDCEHNLAYIAGYFDGEGTVGINRSTRNGSSRYRIQVSLGNTYKPAVDELKTTFGGSIHPHSKGKSNHRQMWYWTVNGVAAYNFLSKVLPYLREKQAQAQEVMDFYSVYGLGRSVQYRRTGKQKEDQEARYNRLRTLKVVEYAA